jgi:hypothetical protein
MEGGMERLPERRDTGVKGDGTPHDNILDSVIWMAWTLCRGLRR